MSNPKATKTKRPTVRPPLPESHKDVALADINDVKALVRLSDSKIYDDVRKGLFPAPVIRQPRFTRWKLSAIRAWLIERTGSPGGA